MLDTESRSTCDQLVGTTARTDVVGDVALAEVVLGGVVVVVAIVVVVIVGVATVVGVAGVVFEVLLGNVLTGCAGV